MRKYRAFWWMTGIIALTYPGINYILYTGFNNLLKNEDAASQVLKMLVGNPFTFPEVWHTVAYASSLFIFIPATIVIMFITNEYTYKTHRQNVIDGWSRNQFMTSKIIDVVIISFLVTLLYVIVAVIIGFINMEEGNTASIWEKSYFIGLFGLQAFAQLSVAFLIAFLTKRAFVALGIFIFYAIILDNILAGLANYYKIDAGHFLPIEISDRLIPAVPFMGRLNEEKYLESINAVNNHVIYTILFTAIIWILCFRLNSRRDF